MRVQSLAKKAAALVCAIALAAVPVMGLSGCGGPKDEDVIKQTLTADLDALKSVDEDTVKSAMGDATWNEMQQYGVDPYEFYSDCVKNFSYDNVAVQVDGDTAKATFEVSNIDIEQVMQSWMSDVVTYASSQEALDDYTNLGEDGIAKKMMAMLTDKLAADDAPMTTKSMSLDFEKSDGTWQPSDASQLQSIVFAGADLSSLDNL